MAEGKKKKAASTKAAPPADETKGAKFVRLGNARLGVALKKIQLIGNLAGSGYESTDAQVSAIRTALNDAVKATMDKFAKSGTADAPKLDLGAVV